MSQVGNNVARRLGGGIVEISAVATLLGAPISEAMTLGLKSAAGLPWASITIFGLLHVAKASIAAAVPDWLREPLGLQNDNVDAAIGTLHEAISSYRIRTRIELGEMTGILTRSPDEDVPTSNWQPLESVRRTNPAHAQCIYRCDRSLDLTLGTVSESDSGKPIMIHEFKEDYGYRPHQTKEIMLMVVSLSKMGEAAVLKVMGSNYLWLLSCLPWLYGLVCSVVLLTLRLSHDRMSNSNYDVIVGRLPSPLYAGGPGTIMCGIPRNVRRSRAWRSAWIGYFVVSVVGLIGTFLVLGDNSANVVFIWIGFQAFWLLLRTAVFYYSDNAAGWCQSLPVGKRWKDTPRKYKLRTMQLVLALAGLHASQHPRGINFYSQDVASLPKIITLFGSTGWTLTEIVWLSEDDLHGNVYLQDVANDNILRCINWVNGAFLPNNELYDSCLAFIRVHNRALAVPAVRVSSCQCKHGPSKNLPRGNSHVCSKLMSVFWIPATSERPVMEADDFTGGESHLDFEPVADSQGSSHGWMYATSFDMKGKMTCSYMTAEELDKKLELVEWQISLTTRREFDQIVDVARGASRSLLSMIKDLVDRDAPNSVSASSKDRKR